MVGPLAHILNSNLLLIMKITLKDRLTTTIVILSYPKLLSFSHPAGTQRCFRLNFGHDVEQR
jgi:hypothetical protein